MLQAIYSVLNALLWVAIGASAVMWIRLVRRYWGQRPGNTLESIVPLRPRDRPFWSPFDALVMIGAIIIVSQVLMLLTVSQGWIEVSPDGQEPSSPSFAAQLAPIAVTSIAGLCAIATVISWLRLIDQDASRKLGLTLTAADLRLGLKASLMILPPVLLIAAAVSHFVPYEHSVLQSLANITSPVVFVATLVGTAVVGPLVEEFLFRVLLQGGLQGWADRESDEWKKWSPRSHWPIVVSSFVFAMLHIGGQGAAPIPLFVLALGLGYLYRQTGCIVAPLVVHMVLNGLTLVVEMVKLHAG
jgi:membrane protease YdiL (CAAX protease family)